MTMAPKKVKSDAATVLQHAETLFRRQGYGNTTMSEIGTKSHLLKGSVYHYFPSKEEIGLQIIRKVSEEFRSEILYIAYNENLPRAARLTQMMTLTQAYLASRETCLMAHLGLETAFSNVRFSQLIQDFFHNWVAAIAHVLEQEYGEKRSIIIAQDTVAKIEGAMVFSAICNDQGPLERIIKDAMDLLPSCI